MGGGLKKGKRVNNGKSFGGFGGFGVFVMMKILMKKNATLIFDHHHPPPYFNKNLPLPSPSRSNISSHSHYTPPFNHPFLPQHTTSRSQTNEPTKAPTPFPFFSPYQISLQQLLPHPTVNISTLHNHQ